MVIAIMVIADVMMDIMERIARILLVLGVFATTMKKIKKNVALIVVSQDLNIRIMIHIFLIFKSSHVLKQTCTTQTEFVMDLANVYVVLVSLEMIVRYETARKIVQDMDTAL